MNATFEWAPLLSYEVIAGLGVASAALFLLAWRKRVPDFYMRGVFFILLGALLCNPVVLHENRQPLPDKVLIVVDESPSQNIP
jgi:hypothetical protein